MFNNPYGKTEASFESFNEFVKSLMQGGEIEFIYNSRYFTLFKYGGKIENNDAISFSEVGNEKSEILVLPEDVEKIGDFIIDGKKLRDIVRDIIVTWRNV